MFLDRGPRRICGNIYGCPQAARFLKARELSLHKNQCGFCSEETTYPEFMQHGLILSCRMCALLSRSRGGLTGNGLSDCFQRLGHHCPLCAFEYTSLAGREQVWLESASKVILCFLGGASRHELAKRFYHLLTQMGGCGSLANYLNEILFMLEEKRRRNLNERIQEASRILKIDLLGRTRTTVVLS